jgi:hypothetical protein
MVDAAQQAERYMMYLKHRQLGVFDTCPETWKHKALQRDTVLKTLLPLFYTCMHTPMIPEVVPATKMQDAKKAPFQSVPEKATTRQMKGLVSGQSTRRWGQSIKGASLKLGTRHDIEKCTEKYEPSLSKTQSSATRRMEARREELMLLWPEIFSEDTLKAFSQSQGGLSLYQAGISWYRSKRVTLKRKSLNLSPQLKASLARLPQGKTLLTQLANHHAQRASDSTGYYRFNTENPHRHWLDPERLKPLNNRTQFIDILITLCTMACKETDHWLKWFAEHERQQVLDEIMTLRHLLCSKQGWIEVIETLPNIDPAQQDATQESCHEELFYNVLWFPYNPWFRSYLRSLRGRPPLHWNEKWQNLIHFAVQHTPIPLPDENLPLCFTVPTIGTMRGYSLSEAEDTLP